MNRVLSERNANVRSRPSFGAASRGKADFGGAARRSTLAVPSKAGASAARPAQVRSSMMPSSSRFGKADPRPLSDKHFQVAQIKQLISFLEATGYEKTVSEKQLHSPSSKDFMSIVTFLFRQIDPNFSPVPTKMEDEVPAMFKALGYPYNISKRSLYAVGSMHAWPNLLGALSWLVELIEFNEEATRVDEEQLAAQEAGEADPALTGDESTSTQLSEKLFFAYISQAYSHFLAGSDNFDVLDQQMSAQFERRNATTLEEIHQLEVQKEALAADVAAAASGSDRLAKLVEAKGTLASDLKKFERLINDLQAHLEQKKTKAAERERDVKTRQSDLEKVEAEKQALGQTLATQTLSTRDVDRIQSQRMALQQQLDTLRSDAEAIDAQIAEARSALAAKRSAIESRLAVYSTAARTAGLIPSNAARANNFDYSLSLDVSTDTLSREIADSFKPRLDAALTATQQEAASKQAAVFAANSDLDRVTEEVTDAQESLQRAEAKLRKMEAEFTSVKERFAKEIEVMEDEVEALESVLTGKYGEEEGTGNVMDAESAAAQAAEEYRQVTAALAAERAQLTKILETAAELAAAHRDTITDVLNQVADTAQDAAASVPPLG
jgi:kinetochore protein NDC80